MVHGQTVVLFFTNDKIKLSSLISIVNEFQMIEPRYGKEFLPLKWEFAEIVTSPGLDRKVMMLSFVTNNCVKLFP